MSKIAIASDHGGFELKQEIVKHLIDNGFETDDLGTNSSESVDYPDFAHLVAERIADGKNDRAILVCGTGIGMSITANRYTHIRASLCNDIYSAKMSRFHNNANVLVLGGRVVGSGLALEIVSTWLEAEFEGGRHERRINKMAKADLEDAVQKLIDTINHSDEPSRAANIIKRISEVKKILKPTNDNSKSDKE